MKDHQIETKLFNLALDPVLEGRADQDRYDILHGKGFKDGDFDALVPTYLSDRSLGEMGKDELISIINAFKGEYVKSPVNASKPRIWAGNPTILERWEWNIHSEEWTFEDYSNLALMANDIFVIGEKPTSPPPPKEELETCDKVDWL